MSTDVRNFVWKYTLTTFPARPFTIVVDTEAETAFRFDSLTHHRPRAINWFGEKDFGEADVAERTDAVQRKCPQALVMPGPVQWDPEGAQVRPPIRCFRGVENSPTSPKNRPHPGPGALHECWVTFIADLSLFPITRTPPAPPRPPKRTNSGSSPDTTLALKLTGAGNNCSHGDFRVISR